MKRVVALPPFDTQYFSGTDDIEIGAEATNLFALVRALDAMAPGFAEAARDGAGFAVDGAVQADWTAVLPADCEVLIVPRVAGGAV